MFCPICKDEFVDGVTHCTTCDADLVDELPAEPEPALRDLVPVFASSDEADLITARGLLESAGIPFVTTNEGLQELFAAGRIGGFNPVIGQVQILVDRESLGVAAEALETLRQDVNEN